LNIRTGWANRDSQSPQSELDRLASPGSMRSQPSSDAVSRVELTRLEEQLRNEI